ncbi:MAG: multisubunit potassium/proton antiporter, PhaG subunit [Pseudomonadota bacterium]|jgi:multicomponent K+:H+ antiporter subunit G
MTLMLDLLISGLLVIAGAFGLTGSYGLVRLRDRMQRLHAPTKASTVGVGAALCASILHGLRGGDGLSWQELLVLVFLFVTAPVTANYLSKVHLHSRRYDADLPPTGTPRPWATFDDQLDDPDPPRLPPQG